MSTQTETNRTTVGDQPGDEQTARGRLLGIDVGTRRVGLAISDALRLTVRPLPAIERGSWKRLLNDIARVVAEYEVTALIIGWPLRLDGAEGDAAAGTRNLAEKFRLSLSIPVFLHDERLTTVAAEERLRDAGLSREETKQRVDSEAAAIILQDFINQRPG